MTTVRPVPTLALRPRASARLDVPSIETIRGLLYGAPAAGDVIPALIWCVAIAVVGYIWARSTFTKRA